MSMMLRGLLIVGSLLTAFYVLRRVRRSRMRTEDSVFWLLFSLILVIMGLLPDLVTSLADWMGVMSAANLVFLIVIFFLIMKLFLMDQRISVLQRQVTETAQQVAIQGRAAEENSPAGCEKQKEETQGEEACHP